MLFAYCCSLATPTFCETLIFAKVNFKKLKSNGPDYCTIDDASKSYTAQIIIIKYAYKI